MYNNKNVGDVEALYNNKKLEAEHEKAKSDKLIYNVSVKNLQGKLVHIEE